jgi:Holliday junction DNA helicase RuvA
MLFSLRGTIIDKYDSTVAIEVRDVGYEVLVSHPDDYEIGDHAFLYVYEVVREDDNYLVGFSTLLEKNAFVSLISVKGVGPKIAVGALSATTPEMLNRAIASNNVAYLKKLPGIGGKAAAQIILDLKGQLTGEKGNPDQYEDVKAALKQLGFKNAQIERVLADINEPNATNEQVLAIALKMLRKK